MIQSYDLGDGKPAYLVEDMMRAVESAFGLCGIRIKVPYPRNDHEATLLGIMFDQINSPMLNVFFSR